MQSQICKKEVLAEGFYYRPLIAQIARKISRGIFFMVSRKEREEREDALATPVLAVRREHTSDSEVCSAISATRRET